MKNILVIFIVLIISSCSEKNNTPSELITAYFKGFKNADYSQVKKTIADSLITIEGDYTMAFSRESYYEKFKWDSVFKPTYKLLSIDTQAEQTIATVSLTSLKLEFLKNSPMTCRYQFYFTSGKISKIENIACSDADWEVWEKEVNTLVQWVQRNHPELDGFIYDLSMKGAIDYVNAIALYKKSQAKAKE
ncbi:hypothetical protein [Cellulophaga sp. Hel_I_12]|uniref:hypothetical protein n=1 Tax=Cellulophaga sp. Hel_I_12 TaxID=1249972 RepID=UPI000645E5B2|nr:hypothetical protein [Cellulophaga sp. Hel_I_12]